MAKIIEAIYENGVFKPIQKINIKEHKKVEIILSTEMEDSSSEENLLDGIIDIAKDCSDTDLSAQHDKYLYGGVSE